MKKTICICIFFIGLVLSNYAQTLPEARKLYLEGDYAAAMPVFEKELQSKPNDAALNHWYGVCLYHTGGDLQLAEQHLQLANKKKIQDSNLYLSLIYTQNMEVDQALSFLDNYEAHLKNKRGKTKTQIATDSKILEETKILRSRIEELSRMINHVQDVVIIDSLVVDRNQFLTAYHLSPYNGSLTHYSTLVPSYEDNQSTIFMSEHKDKVYFSEPDDTGFHNIYSMELLGKKYGNKKVLSENRFNMDGDIMYPYVMSDGVTLVFAAKNTGDLDGFNLYITRYNTSTGQYLTPETLNLPFNSNADDFMYVIDDDKHIGWFASNRNTSNDEVCVYTFIPNTSMTFVDSEDTDYLIQRAKIRSIKDSWKEDEDYTDLIALARENISYKEYKKHDFEFVINDSKVYYTSDSFQNMKAKNLLSQWLAAKKELESTDEKLENIRQTIANNPNIEINTREIRSLEMKVLNLPETIENLENQIRRLELSID